jgi:hypothetical protein
MLFIFIFFSLIPFVSAINKLTLHFFSNIPYFYLLVILLTFILSIVTIISIYTLNLDLRWITTIIFSTGIVLNFDDPYFLAFGVVLCWLFYEFWFIFARFLQLDKEYFSYKQGSFERKRLSLNLRNQVISFLIIGWITISLSWIVIYLSSNYYFELGRDFGTLGIATSLTMIALVYLTQRYVLKQPAKVELEN